MISIYVVFRDLTEARKICTLLLDKELIACANMWPITSIFKWEGKFNESKEIAALIKGKRDFETIKSEIKKVHSYKIPCIVSYQLQKSNDEYVEWVEAN